MVTVNFDQFTHLEKVKNGKTITKATVFFFFFVSFKIER